MTASKGFIARQTQPTWPNLNKRLSLIYKKKSLLGMDFK